MKLLPWGADRAIHLSDRKFAGADTLATSNAIAGALRMLDFDLVITGRQAIDGDTAQVGPQIAEHLDLPQVTYVEHLEFDGDSCLQSVNLPKKDIKPYRWNLPVSLLFWLRQTKRYMSVRGNRRGIRSGKWKSGILIISVWMKLNGIERFADGMEVFTKGAKAAGKVFEVEPAEAVDVIIEKLKEIYYLIHDFRGKPGE